MMVTPVLGRVYWTFRHEPCMMGWVKGSQPEHDSKHEFNSGWELDWEGKSRIVGSEHPTQKPVGIFARPILWLGYLLMTSLPQTGRVQIAWIGPSAEEHASV